MPPPETGKRRAARIPLDYYRRPTRLDWGRGWGALAVAALLALGWAAYGWLPSGWGRNEYSRGPVTAAHATWDAECTACHTPFTPLSGDAWAGRFLLDVHAMNQKCEACHQGPPHHEHATPDLACAACHHDHRGRDASLVRLADGDCVQCHRDLAAHLTGKAPAYENRVTAFASQHPEFRLLRDTPPGDPRKLKFSHKVHVGDEHLQCAACHHLDAGDAQVRRDGLTDVPAAAVLPARAAGAYYLPINYGRDCRSCHALEFDRTDHAEVLHRWQPAQVVRFIEQYYTGRLIKNPGSLGQPFVSLRPLPGRLPDGMAAKASKDIRDHAESAQTTLFRQPKSAEKYVFGKSACAECHYYERADDSQVVPDKIVPTNVPDVWFSHAVFDHSAHRAVDCRACHAGAYPPAADAQAEEKNVSKQDTGVRLPGVSTCQKCHAPRSVWGNEVQGGRGFACTECHRYHNGDAPLAGKGAKERDAPTPGTIEDFLSGRLGGANAP